MMISLRVGDDFDFLSAVCSHGFFMLAPNTWDPDKQRLETIVPSCNGPALRATIHFIPARRTLRISVDAPSSVSATSRSAVRQAVRRMLRIDEDLTPFHQMCRRDPSMRAAARMRFGRLLRSATLFEDIVKVICTCNITWRQTVAMVERLVQRYGTPVSDGGHARAFPTPEQLAAARPSDLRTRCGLGYRAEYVSTLARDAAAGRRDVAELESNQLDTDAIYKRLRRIKGVGDYAAGNLCMLLGCYDRLAIDSEMIRFERERTGREPTPTALRKEYERWRPYSFLVYWWRLWSGYCAKHGPAHEWTREIIGRRITE